MHKLRAKKQDPKRYVHSGDLCRLLGILNSFKFALFISSTGHLLILCHLQFDLPYPCCLGGVMKGQPEKFALLLIGQDVSPVLHKREWRQSLHHQERITGGVAYSVCSSSSFLP
ncbi:hypothetical protein V6N11_032459 [Hibiscus sabdariffa]|uniref:Uncharacterized protein n=1 Tax=Hibiscus sabdariffa TaxID=183260 RepID=A0ABR2T0Q0_9ROSI